jgi:hypothetical protein
VREGLILETVIIGGSAMAAGYVLKLAGVPQGKPLTWFCIGALTHLAWEASGGNRWYLENRDPGTFPKGLIS